MSLFLKSGTAFTITNEAALDIHKQLPPGNYIVKVTSAGVYYLDQVDSFVEPTRIYGDTVKQANRIMSTFNDRPASTGILLTGEKGSGKTMLAKMLSLMAATDNIPTLIINTPYHGDVFNAFIQSIDQPCVVLFDEFEKVYDRDDQEAILTLLDGVFPTKKLFILTCNNEYRIDEHMRNRPGRLYYALSFEGLTAEFITEYCLDNLLTPEHVAGILTIATTFDAFNFDVMKALVEEMNRYGENAFDAIKWINAKPALRDGSVYEIAIRYKGKLADSYYPTEFEGNPLVAPVISGHCNDDEEDVGCGHEFDWSVQFTDLVSFDGTSGVITYAIDADTTAVFTKRKHAKFSYGSL